MKKSFTLVLLVILLTITLIPLKSYSMNNENPITNSFSDLKMDERKLWIDHVSWTRNFIISDLASLPDKDVVLQRLLKNQDEILQTFYQVQILIYQTLN